MRRSEHLGPADLPGMQSLAERVFPVYRYRSVGELAWNYALSFDRPADNLTALWRERDLVVAWGWLDRPAELMLQVDPACPGLADQVLDWAESLAAGPLTVAIADTETPARALGGRGYRVQDTPFFSCLERTLESLPAVPALPSGYRIRPLACAPGPDREGDPEADRARWVTAHRAAFPGSRFDTARRAALTRVPPCRPDLDLVVQAPDSSFAAYCLGWYDERNQAGEFEPVGTHPGHRRLGLAGAVCTAMLHAFAAAGASCAIVNARGDAGYPAPKRLYEALGFTERTRTRTFARQLSQLSA